MNDGRGRGGRGGRGGSSRGGYNGGGGSGGQKPARVIKLNIIIKIQAGGLWDIFLYQNKGKAARVEVVMPGKVIDLLPSFDPNSVDPNDLLRSISHAVTPEKLPGLRLLPINIDGREAPVYHYTFKNNPVFVCAWVLQGSQEVQNFLKSDVVQGFMNARTVIGASLHGTAGRLENNLEQLVNQTRAVFQAAPDQHLSVMSTWAMRTLAIMGGALAASVANYQNTCRLPRMRCVQFGNFNDPTFYFDNNLLQVNIRMLIEFPHFKFEFQCVSAANPLEVSLEFDRGIAPIEVQTPLGPLFNLARGSSEIRQLTLKLTDFPPPDATPSITLTYRNASHPAGAPFLVHLPLSVSPVLGLTGNEAVTTEALTAFYLDPNTSKAIQDFPSNIEYIAHIANCYKMTVRDVGGKRLLYGEIPSTPVRLLVLVTQTAGGFSLESCSTHPLFNAIFFQKVTFYVKSYNDIIPT